MLFYRARPARMRHPGTCAEALITALAERLSGDVLDATTGQMWRAEPSSTDNTAEILRNALCANKTRARSLTDTAEMAQHNAHTSMLHRLRHVDDR